MNAKNFLTRNGVAMILTICCATTVQGQIMKKIFNSLDKALNVNGQTQKTSNAQVQKQSQDNDDCLIFDLEKINQQLIDVKLDDNDLYKYKLTNRFYEYEIVTKYSPQHGEARTTVRKYPNLTYTSELYEKAMEGDPLAQNKLGYCYIVGLGGKTDRGKAITFFRESAKNGMYESAVTVYRLEEKADDLLKEAADKNYAPACWYYYEITHDKEYLMKAARLLHPEAYYELGIIAYQKKLYKNSMDLFYRAEELDCHKNNYIPYSIFEDDNFLMAQSRYYYYSDNADDNEKFFLMARYAPNGAFSIDYNQFAPKSNSFFYRYLNVDDLYQKLKTENKLTDNIKIAYTAKKSDTFDEMQLYKFRKNLEDYANNNGNIYAYTELARYYYTGRGVSAKDVDKAKAYLMKAADSGLISAARSMLAFFEKDLQKNNPELIYKYETMINPKKAEQNRLKAEEEKAKKESMLKEMKPLAGTWKKDNGNWLFTFDEKGNVTITSTSSVNKKIKDPYFNFNKIMYDVVCTTVVECETAYKVENGVIAFMEAIPFKLKSLKIDKPTNPNEYVKEYVNKYGSVFAPQPMLSSVSGKITFISPTEVRIEGDKGPVTLRKIK